MKKYIFLLGALVAGYFGLTGIAFVINPNTQSMPDGFRAVMGMIGVIGLGSMRFFWKKFKIT